MVAAAAIVLVGLSSPASASIINGGSQTFSGFQAGPLGHAHSASAKFEWVGGQLKITLTNTYNYDYAPQPGIFMVPTDVLTALFFDIAPEQNLTAANPFATVATGSTVVNPLGGVGDPDGPGDNVTAPSPTDGGWKYDYNDVLVTQNQGFGTAGFGVFNGSQVNGFDYGLVGSGYQPGDANGGNGGLDTEPLIQSSVVFTINGVFGTNGMITISNVRFQYGTALGDPHFGPFIIPGGDTGDPVPEPTSLALAGIAGLGLVFGRFRQRRQAA